MTVPLAGAAYAAFPQSGASAAGASPAAGSTGTAAIDQAAAAVQSFATDLYGLMAPAGGPTANLVYSPYSIILTLAMARQGANGTTATEMDRVLHAPQPAPLTLDAGFAALNSALSANYLTTPSSDAKQPVLRIADSLWAQKDLVLRSSFTDALSTYFGAEPHLVDFRGATEAARVEINKWISDRTNAKIPQLLAQGTLDTLTRLVLANAIYLKANWLTPFDPRNTSQSAFTRSDGKVLTVPMMSARGWLGYVDNLDSVAVRLPYVGNRLAMTVILPTSGDLAGYEATLDGTKLAGILTANKGATVQLSMPRWTFRVPSDLGAVLAKLGMGTAFTRNADFSGIAVTKETLAISKVIHEAFIAVDEYGTEAAAATAIAIGTTAVPSDPKKVVLNRPFLFVIHDVATAAPLFIGRVADPSAR